MNLLEQINTGNTPKHIAIIMDGNGRWAKKQGHERLYGHSIGVESVRAALNAATKTGVKFLTIYAFSTENWSRPQEEIDGLMNLLVHTIANEVNELNANGVKLSSIGHVSGLPNDCQLELATAIDATKNNTTIELIIALNYSSRWEITTALKELAQDVIDQKITIDEITEEHISNQLSTAHIPDPELLIRTSGEHRLSNFLLWQSAYTEFHFTPVLWPDFREDDLYTAILDYQSRERRFGMVSEQL